MTFTSLRNSVFLICISVLCMPVVYGQVDQQKTFFSEVIGQNIRKYRYESRRAIKDKDDQRLQFLFDSLVDHVVINSYLDNFKVRKFNGRRIELDHFEKPMYLITYADWCTPGVGELPALNDIVDKNHESVDFVILFWGPRRSVRKIKQRLNRKITVLFVNEKENDHSFIIKRMKHSLGFPTTFLLSQDQRIISVSRMLSHHYNLAYAASYNKHFQQFTQSVSLLKAQSISRLDSVK